VLELGAVTSYQAPAWRAARAIATKRSTQRLAGSITSLFEIGPVARLDVLRDVRGTMPTDFLLTMNLEIGLSVWR
jgi:hypothetical protein